MAPIFSQFSSGGGGRAIGFGMGPMTSGGGASISIQLTAQSQGRNFGSYSLTNTFSMPITTNWGYNGYFAFTAPADDVYRITTRGANGRYQGVENATPENLGAQIIADVNVSAGWIIIFTAGQTGDGVCNDNAGAGGGGMSVVAYSTNTSNSTSSVSQANPLVVAGGGGGSCYNRTGQDNSRGYANTGQRGRAGQASGYGAESHGWPLGGGGLATSNQYNIAGWNGGGFNSGGSGNQVRSGGAHGDGWKQGGRGGTNQNGANYAGFGGGGGGANNCGYGGGAGGYSGGGSGGYSAGCGGHGGGGGSYYQGNLISASNYNTRYGYVSILSSDQY